MASEREYAEQAWNILYEDPWSKYGRMDPEEIKENVIKDLTDLFIKFGEDNG